MSTSLSRDLANNVVGNTNASDEERLRALVFRDLEGSKLTRFVLDEENARGDYTERIFVVTWKWHKSDRCGTHRACLDSTGKGMLVWGHYDMTDEQALRDLIERTPKLSTNSSMVSINAMITKVHA